MKKIIYVIEDISVIGGRENMILSKVKYLSQTGYKTEIISHNIENINNIQKIKNCNYVNLGLSRKLLGKSDFNKRLKYSLERQFIISKPNYVIFMCGAGLNVYNKIHISAPKIIEIHGGFEFYRYRDSNKNIFIKNIINIFKFKRLKRKLGKFNKCVFLSKKDESKWQIKNSVTIPNFINTTEIESHFIKTNNVNEFISAGRLSFEKGFDLLIKAWVNVKQENKDLRLSIFGNGSEERRIKELIAKYKLQDVISIYPFKNDIQNKIINFNALILPSRNESFGMVILESLAKSVPVIAFNIEGGVQDLVETDVNGILVKKQDTTALSNAILKMSNEEYRNSLAMQTISRANEFSSEAIMPLWISLFKSLDRRI